MSSAGSVTPVSQVERFVSWRGAVALGSSVALALGAVKYGQSRAAGRFARSLMSEASGMLGDASPYLPRRGGAPFPLTQTRVVILKAPRLSGTTTLLSHAIRYEWYPWWRRMLSPPRGMLLEGQPCARSPSEWFAGQLDKEASKSPITSLRKEIIARHSDQRIRLLLRRWFGKSLPRLLRAQPSLVIIDNTEDLIAADRARFLLAVRPLVDMAATRPGSLQLVFVVNTNEAVKSLQALNGGE